MKLILPNVKVGEQYVMHTLPKVVVDIFKIDNRFIYMRYGERSWKLVPHVFHKDFKKVTKNAQRKSR